MPVDPFDPQQLARFQAITTALIQYTPEHFRTAYCQVEQAPQHGTGRFKYRIGSKDHPGESADRPSPGLHEAVDQLYRYWLKNQQPFPGIEATVALQPDGNWKSGVRMVNLDARKRSEEEEDRLWQSVYQARENFFVEQFGPLPNDIQKLMNLMGVWPGGGLFPIVASKRDGIGVCTSFGLTNVDLPTPVKSGQHQQTMQGGQPSFSSKLEPRTPRWLPPEVAGYGYEIMILTPKPETWPLLPVSWVVQMELLNDIDLPGRVDQYQGLTVESVRIGDGSQSTDFFLEPALPPLPDRCELPNGTMRLLVATRITRDEMNFALEHGRPALRDRLNRAGVGQMSVLDRPSAVK